MIAAATELQSHPNIGAIYDDMVKEVASPVPRHSRAHVKTFTVSTKTFDGADVSPKATSDEGAKTFITVNTKEFDGSTANLSKKKEKRSFSRKNSIDSVNVKSEKKKSWSTGPADRNFSRRNSTDSAFSIYNDDDMWSQRIGEIMNRDAAAAPQSSPQEQYQPPIENIRVTSSSGATGSSSRPRIRRCQSTDCPITKFQSQQGRENAWLKKQQFGGSLSRRNSMEGGDKALFERNHSRSTSPKFIPPLDSFDLDGRQVAGNLVAEAVAATTDPNRGFSRRNSMTRSRSPKFIEPLDSSDYDESRVFKGRARRRHTHAGPDPFSSFELETLRESRVMMVEVGSNHDNVAEQVKQRLGGLEEPSTPKADSKDERNTVPRKPFSRRNSVEGVDPSIFPSLPMLDNSDNSDDTDPNFDLGLLFERLVKEDEADDVSSNEEGKDDQIMQRRLKSNIRRRCSTGGLRTFERENFRNFIEDTEGDDHFKTVPEADRRGSLFRKCSTGGLRTLQRENSRDLYSDDCSLDGEKKGRMHLSNDTSFNAYLKQLTREADVDTSKDANIIDQHVGGAVRRRSSRCSVSSIIPGTEDPVDFAAFINRVGQGIPCSQTVSTVANTTYSGDSNGICSNPKKKLPHNIHMPSHLDESVSSLENSPEAKGHFSIKESPQVNFRSSKSRSIRRLASKDGIEDLKELAECMEVPATRRSSWCGIRTPEEIILKDLPCLTKNIDHDLVTERASYQQRRSSGSGRVAKKTSSLGERSSTVQVNAVQPRRPLEPPGTSACIFDEDDAPKTRKSHQTYSDSFLLNEKMQKAEVVSGRAQYKPKRRRSSAKEISEDRRRFGKQGKSLKNMKEGEKKSPKTIH